LGRKKLINEKVALTTEKLRQEALVMLRAPKKKLKYQYSDEEKTRIATVIEHHYNPKIN
jgi:hypothetical protein